MGQGSGTSHRLTPAERLELLRLARAGEPHQGAARAVGCSSKTVPRLLGRIGGIRPRETARSARRMPLAEREEISRGLRAGESCRGIAARLGRSPSTVSHEVAAAGQRTRYHAWQAEAQARRRARRPKIPELWRRPSCATKWGAVFGSDGHRDRFERD